MRNYLLLLLIGLLILDVNPAMAGLNDELKGMFDDMVNVTPGGAYETQRRGVITGGEIVTRNKIMNPNLVSFIPPGIKAGCGGIDMFGGSFSFINSAQFTQLMRSIAQAAAGYAFQLAIEGMCPTCAQVIGKLQKDIAFINSLMKNSCEAGKLVVDSTIGPSLKALHASKKDEVASSLSDEGFLSDFYAARHDGTRPPDKLAIDNGKESLFTGNIVKKSLTSATAGTWFAHGDSQLEAVLMSLTGTYVTSKKADNSGMEYIYHEAKIEPRDFIEGGQLTIYKCIDDDCLLPEGNNTEIITVVGMRARIKEMIIGTGSCEGCTGGILRKMQARTGGAVFSSQEQKFIQATSPGAYGLLSKLSHEPGAAFVVADQLINVLAVEVTNKMVEDMYDAVRISLETGHEMDTKMIGTMRDRKEKINQERIIAGQTVAGVSIVLDTYSNIEKDLRNNAFHKQR